MAAESSVYFLKEKDSLLPDYRINNVIVEQNSIRIFCSLDKDEDLNYDSFFGSSEFLKFVNTEVDIFFPEERIMLTAEIFEGEKIPMINTLSVKFY